MSPERWHEIGEVFGAALELPPGERRHFLDRVCEDDAELRREVHRLLAAEADSPDFLEEPVCRLAHRDADSRDRRLGPYRLERKLAEGGMGTVYLASRGDREYRRRVAVKLVRRDLASPELLRRFRNERQILAALEHPSIARLYDGGTTEDGRPYLVMEYVDGLPVTEYCNRRRLTVSERLELFLKVCDAVRYAHRNFLVHRDIKPSNILVTGDGVPKLLDFGIAKLLGEAEIFEAVETNASGGHAMTPNYASPEQIGRETVTTLSDVYSLGVLFYELLTGRLPHRTSGRLLHEIQLAIYQECPERPSQAVGRLEESRPGVTAEVLARQRSTRPAELVRQLSGDLDLILLKALRKEPDRRYRSVGRLAEDVSLHLRRRPVRARPDTLAYRGGKFKHRHPAGVTAAALVMTLFVIFLGVFSRQSQVIDHQRRDAGTVTRDLTGFLLDQGSARVDLGAVAEGETWFAKALETNRRHAGDEQVAVAEVKEALRPGRAASLDDQARLHFARGEFALAETLYREALELRRDVLVDEASWGSTAAEARRQVAASLHNLARCLGERGAYDEAEALFGESLAMTRQLGEGDSPEVATLLNNLAVVLSNRGDLTVAEALFHQVLEMRLRFFGEEHPHVAQARYSLGRLLHARGELDAAEELYRGSAERLVRALPADHPAWAYPEVAMAHLWLDRGRAEDAELLLRDALPRLASTHAAGHWRIADAGSLLGESLAAQGRYAEAEPLLRQGYVVLQAQRGGRAPRTRQALARLAALYRSMKQEGEGEVLAQLRWETF